MAMMLLKIQENYSKHVEKNAEKICREKMPKNCRENSINLLFVLFIDLIAQHFDSSEIKLVSNTRVQYIRNSFIREP